jgi:hypothetical protein
MLECRVGPQRRGDQESLEQRRPHGEWPASVAWSNAVEWLLEG